MFTMQAGLASQDLFDLVRTSGPVAQTVLLLLAFFSVVSWAITIDRLWLFRKAESQDDSFLETFRSSSKFSQVRAACERYRAAPLGRMFEAAYTELSAQIEERRQAGAAGAPNPASHINLISLERCLQRAAHAERRQMERMMFFLATTAAVAPFIGLFGTVWGIMNAFRSIGAYGSANLAVVAPGISEALITTAAGLAAAIPAVIAYNHLFARIRRLSAAMQDFGLEFLSVVEKTFPRGGG